MRNALFIAIGVHKAVGLAKLDGVLSSVEDMVRWAGANGYDTSAITDDPVQPVAERDVTVERIRTALPAAALLDRPRIVVYFCGHGLYARGDQHWVLSAGPDNRRISALGFREALETYGPKQIAFFSDACSTPWVQNATADNVVDNYPGDSPGSQKDVFYSTREGAPSFAVPAQGGEPAYCVFSRTLAQILSATDPDPLALDPLYLEAGKKVISSQSLAGYLEAKVPAVALASGRSQRPNCNTGFRPFDNIYVRLAPVAPPPAAAQPPGAGMTKFMVRRKRADAPRPKPRQTPLSEARGEARAERQALSRSEWRGPLMDRAAQVIGGIANHERLFFIDRGTGLPEPILFEGDLESVVSPTQTVHRLGANQRDTGIVQCGDFFTPVAHYRGLWCALAFRTEVDASHSTDPARGADLMSWSSAFETYRFHDSVDALKGMSNGIFTSDDVVRLSHSLRVGKHIDPMLGVVSAYLYAQVGDLDSIRRMAFFYRSHGQGVPFDIALLGKLPFRRTGAGFSVEVPAVSATPNRFRDPEAPEFTWCATDATEVKVAGLTPFLRAGWQLLGRSEHDIHRRCDELMSHLSNSAIATIEGQEPGQALRQAFTKFRKDQA